MSNNSCKNCRYGLKGQDETPCNECSNAWIYSKYELQWESIEIKCKSCEYGINHGWAGGECCSPKKCIGNSEYVVKIIDNIRECVNCEYTETNSYDEESPCYDCDGGTLSNFELKIKDSSETKSDTGKINDSGDRTQFETGAVRDMHEGKGRCDLLPPLALLRLARHFESGCLKYGSRNWELGIPCHSFLDSALRHLFRYMAGDTSEDHAAAALWNIACLMETEEKRPEMMDIPARMENEKYGS